MANIENRIAIVTGASRGIGAAIAGRLAREGYAVVVNYASNAKAAEELVDRIESAGGKALAAQADVSDAAAVGRLVDTTEAALGGVDVLVNNAGVMTLATIADVDEAVVDGQIAINLKGSINTMRGGAEAAHRRSDH